MIEFTKEVEAYSSKLGSNEKTPIYRYKYSDNLFSADVFNSWSRWCYFIKLVSDKKEICHSTFAMKLKTEQQAKGMVEKLINLLHLANKGETWILKGVMIGFTDVSEMEHLKPKSK